MSALLLSLLLAAPLPALKPHLPPQRGADDGRGEVTYATPQGAYLDRGVAEGLEVGATVKLLRKGRGVATCAVQSVADHSAYCVAEGVLPGDGFKFTRPKDKKAKELAPLPSDAELARRAAVLERVELEPVEYTAAPTRRPEARARLLEISYGHTTWTTGGQSDSSFHLERLDFAVRGFEPIADWHLFLDAGVRWWSGRPATFRDPVLAPVLLLVREATVEWAGPKLPWRLAAGRLWTRDVPGLAALDGLLAGWRPTEGFEVGAFGGLLPEATTAGISTERWTAGLFEAWEFRGDGALRLFREQLRAAAVGSPEPRGEVELALQAFLEHPLDFEAAARVGFGDGPFSLDTARLAAAWRPHPRFAVQASGRYVGRLQREVVLPLAPATGVPALHTDALVSWEVLSGLVVAGRVGFSRDFDAQLSRFYVGPEVGLPRLFLGHGGLRAGWLEETGHQGRRSAWLAADLTLFDLARVWGRLAWTQQAPTEGTGDFGAHELGAQVALDFTLPLGFTVRGSVLIHHGLGGDDALRPQGTTAYVWQAGAAWAW